MMSGLCYDRRARGGKAGTDEKGGEGGKDMSFTKLVLPIIYKTVQVLYKSLLFVSYYCTVTKLSVLMPFFMCCCYT